MKKIIGAFIASTVLMSASAFAGVSVGLIDLPSILQNSPQVQAINQNLQNQFKPQQQDILAAQNKLRNEAQQLAPDALAKLSAAQQTSLKNQFAADQKSLQDMVSKFQQQVSQAQNAAMKSFMSQIDTAVKTVAQKDKLDVVLLKPAVVYASDATDVTQEVLAQLPK